jgi:hypothetical protein
MKLPSISGGTPTNQAKAWLVEPCEQWRRENPGQPKYILWTIERFARESADDTGGILIPLVPQKHLTS